MRGIGHFMILFGVVSTIFDLALFAAALGIFDADAGELRSAWFATSLITEVIAILLLRTRRRSWRSLPSGIVVAISIFVVIIVIAVPALGIFATFGLPAISSSYLALITILALGYAASIEFLKSRTGLMR
jgi:Mg2+-importing ATPase